MYGKWAPSAAHIHWGCRSIELDAVMDHRDVRPRDPCNRAEERARRGFHRCSPYDHETMRQWPISEAEEDRVRRDIATWRPLTIAISDISDKDGVTCGAIASCD